MRVRRGTLALLLFCSIWLAQALAQSTSPTSTDAAIPSAAVGTSQRPAPAFTYTPIGPGGSMTANPVLPPAGGKVVVGATLNWDIDEPQNVSSRLGQPFLAYNIFLLFPLTATDKQFLEQTVKGKPFPVLGADNATKPQIMISLEPVNYTDISDATVDDGVADVVTMVSGLNRRGISVYIRFGQEMNGPWYPWGWRPFQYRKAFRKIAVAVKSCTACSGTAMMWAPNSAGAGWPFTGGTEIPATEAALAAYQATVPSAAKYEIAELQAMDTNGNGVIDRLDDPYAPFWPGDDVVDWVGITVYHTGNDYYGQNSVPPPNKFVNAITGKDPVSGAQTSPDFYQIYSAAKNKPFCVAETSANWNSKDVSTNPTGPSMLQIKQAWWQQQFSDATFALLPNYRLSYTFEIAKFGTDLPDVYFDYGYTTTPDQATAFRTYLSTQTAPLFSDGRYAIINAPAASTTTVAPSSSVAPTSSAAAPTSTSAPSAATSPQVKQGAAAAHVKLPGTFESVLIAVVLSALFARL